VDSLEALVDSRAAPADRAAWVASLGLVGFQALRVAQVEADLEVRQDAQADFQGREGEAHRLALEFPAAAKSTGSGVSEKPIAFETAVCNPLVAGCRFSFTYYGIRSSRSICHDLWLAVSSTSFVGNRPRKVARRLVPLPLRNLPQLPRGTLASLLVTLAQPTHRLGESNLCPIPPSFELQAATPPPFRYGARPPDSPRRSLEERTRNFWQLH